MKKMTMVLRVTILVAISVAVMFVSPGQAYRPGDEGDSPVPGEIEFPKPKPRRPEDAIRPLPKIKPKSPVEGIEERLRAAEKPDLVIRIDSVGAPRAENRDMDGRIASGPDVVITVAIPISVTVRNTGTAPATGDIAIMPWELDFPRNVGRSIMFSAPDAYTQAAGSVYRTSIAGGGSMPISGTFYIGNIMLEEYRRIQGTRVRIRVGVDTWEPGTAGLISESNEDNNFSGWRTVTLPPPDIR